MSGRVFFKRVCRGEGREHLHLSYSRTWFFWKQTQNIANKTNFMKIRLCITTESPLHAFKTRQCSCTFSQNIDAMPRSPCARGMSPSRPRLALFVSWRGPRITEYHSQCPTGITCIFYSILALDGQLLLAHVHSGPERNTQNLVDKHKWNGHSEIPTKFTQLPHIGLGGN